MQRTRLTKAKDHISLYNVVEAHIEPAGRKSGVSTQRKILSTWTVAAHLSKNKLACHMK